MKRARLEPEASDEIEAAVYYYDRQRRGLGSEFLLAVGSALEQIEQTPQRFPFYEQQDGFRYAAMQRFPYVLIFQELEAEILVHRCSHARKEPMFTTKRRPS